MKKFDAKSLVAGVIMGTLGVTTVFAATGIKSAVLSNVTVTLNGEPLLLNRSLISVTMDNEQDASVYVPANELLETLGYSVRYDAEKNTLNLTPGNNHSPERVGDADAEGTVVLNFTNHVNQTNIAESGSFEADHNQALILTVTSDIKDGTVDFFLFGPDGKEQRMIIGSTDITKEIPLEKGTWRYNCSGIFKGGGNIKIVGKIQ